MRDLRSAEVARSKTDNNTLCKIDRRKCAIPSLGFIPKEARSDILALSASIVDTRPPEARYRSGGRWLSDSYPKTSSRTNAPSNLVLATAIQKLTRLSRCLIWWVEQLRCRPKRSHVLPSHSDSIEDAELKDFADDVRENPIDDLYMWTRCPVMRFFRLFCRETPPS